MPRGSPPLGAAPWGAGHPAPAEEGEDRECEMEVRQPKSLRSEAAECAGLASLSPEVLSALG